MRRRVRQRADEDVGVAAGDGERRLHAALVGDVVRAHAGERLEFLRRQVNSVAGAGGREVELARLRLRRGDQLLERMHGRGAVHRDDIRRRGKQRHRLERIQAVVGKLAHQGIDRDVRAPHEQRVPVGHGTRHHLGAE